MSDPSSLIGPLLICLCIGGFIAAVGGGILFAVLRSGKAVNRGWGDLATRLGLTFKPAGMFSSPEMKGDFRQRPIRLYTYDSGGQGQRSIHTAAAVTVKNPGNSALEITPSGSLGNVLGKAFKAQDVEVGNPTFDEHFVIKSNPPDLAMKALGEARLQAGIMEVPGAFRIELQGSSLKYTKAGTEANADFLAKMFDTLSDLADRLEELG